MPGNRPPLGALTLTRGADFLHTWTTVDADFLPAGTTARIDFYVGNTTLTVSATWACTVTTHTIECRQESGVCDLIGSGIRYQLMASFPDDPTTDVCLEVGTVHRIQ